MDVIAPFWARCQKEVRLESQILINMMKRFVQNLIYEDGVGIDSRGERDAADEGCSASSGQ